jgi:glucosamine--fructose-6-phosphate aminotransferase (isomerizing)
MGSTFMKSLGKRSSAHIASEWAYYPEFGSEKTLYVVVSQSGETADLIRCLQLVNKHGYKSLTITNTKGSTLEREATYSVLLYAGVEIAVASTKAYSAQVASMALLKGAIENDATVVNDLLDVCNKLEDIKKQKEEFKEIAQQIKDKKHVFFLGRCLDYYLCLEGSLKLKEISYIHSEAYQAGELKHGTISLIDDKSLVMSIVTDDSVKEKRRDIAMELCQRISLERNEEMIGKTLIVMAEGFEDNLYYGRSGGESIEIDPKIYFGAHRDLNPGDFVEVEIKSADVYDLYGEERTEE